MSLFEEGHPGLCIFCKHIVMVRVNRIPPEPRFTYEVSCSCALTNPTEYEMQRAQNRREWQKDPGLYHEGCVGSTLGNYTRDIAENLIADADAFFTERYDDVQEMDYEALDRENEQYYDYHEDVIDEIATILYKHFRKVIK